MTFEVKHSNQSRKFLEKCDKILAGRIAVRIDSLREQPITRDAERIKNTERLFRTRVGDYRILYEVDYRENLVGIVKIDKRPRVYRGL